jgi:hypothetical protein
MRSPNLQQRLYLARAMNEQLEGIFDHDRQLAEGSYVHSKEELEKAVRDSEKEVGKAYKKGNRNAMKFWLDNMKDAKEQLGNIEAAPNAPKTNKKPVTEAVEAELRRAWKAEAQARKGAVKRSGTTGGREVLKAVERRKQLMLKQLSKERLKAGLDPRIPRSRAKTDNKGEASTTTGYKRDVPKRVMDYRDASQAKKQAALRSKGLA